MNLQYENKENILVYRQSYEKRLQKINKRIWFIEFFISIIDGFLKYQNWLSVIINETLIQS